MTRTGPEGSGVGGQSKFFVVLFTFVEYLPFPRIQALIAHKFGQSVDYYFYRQNSFYFDTMNMTSLGFTVKYSKVRLG